QPLDTRGNRGFAPTPPRLLMELLADKDEHLRWWAVQLLGEDKFFLPQVLQRFAAMAREEQSSFVRLSIASVLQRVPVNARLTIAQGLVARAEDANDPNLPLMIWYAIEPAVPEQRTQALQLASQCKIPLVREFIARRLANARAPSQTVQ
ncbi:MAG TPA: HEAT repeat domain-containing protein, partial [Methylomirabilota bacterium]|nr:HEAT repeat domain-containing protein [Methylomirabilota bacterium]